VCVVCVCVHIYVMLGRLDVILEWRELLTGRAKEPALELFVYIYVCVHTHICMHTSIYIYKNIYIYIYICMCIYIHTYICIPLYMYIYIQRGSRAARS